MQEVSRPSSCAVVRFAVGGLALLFLYGCAEMQQMRKESIDVQTKMSETIFLDPVGPDKKVIYCEVRNTSDKDNFDLEGPIKEALTKKGYRVTQNPDEAYYRLQANVLQVSKTDQTAANAVLQGGYGAPVTYVPGRGKRSGQYVQQTDLSTLFAGKDILFIVVTDIQLVEKAAEGVMVRQDSQQSIKQGIGGAQQQTTSEVTKQKKYRTRVVSTAAQSNLKYEEAAPALTQGLSRALSGLF